MFTRGLRYVAATALTAVITYGSAPSGGVADAAVVQETGSGGSRSAPTIAAAGDISEPGIGRQRDTARRVQKLDPDRVLVLGDNQYEEGSLAAYRRFYDPTWGRFKDRTLPSPGNHEYYTRGAKGYFTYFGKSARPQGKSYYSTDLGNWHLVALNSNIARGPRSAQLRWLRQDLAASSQPCTLAFWHHPRFSSGVEHGNDPSMSTFWEALFRQRTDVVLNGHEHNYERFARQTPGGQSSAAGIREFVVGTGGRELYRLGEPEPNSQRRVTGRYGVLELELRDRSYTWRFITPRGRVLDRGGPVACH